MPTQPLRRGQCTKLLEFLFLRLCELGIRCSLRRTNMSCIRNWINPCISLREKATNLHQGISSDLCNVNSRMINQENGIDPEQNFVEIDLKKGKSISINQDLFLFALAFFAQKKHTTIAAQYSIYCSLTSE